MDLTLKQFKWVSTLEGLSFILLLGIAMPLKYVWGIPEAVKVIGMAHGILFILYIMGAYLMKEKLQWSTSTFAAVLCCSVIPFGPFYAERKYL